MFPTDLPATDSEASEDIEGGSESSDILSDDASPEEDSEELENSDDVEEDEEEDEEDEGQFGKPAKKQLAKAQKTPAPLPEKKVIFLASKALSNVFRSK